MVFPSNQVLLEYHGETGAPEETPRLCMRFDALEACLGVAKKSPDDIKIIHSKQEYWQQRQKAFDNVLDYDWTYQSSYAGTLTGPHAFQPTTERIDYDRLKPNSNGSPEILFFAENCLYEDELGDNGLSSFTVKARLMPFGIFVLVRNALRVDGVIFRSCEHRYMVDFRRGTILRERRLRQDPYEVVVSLVGQSAYRDHPDAVADRLSIFDCVTDKVVYKVG